MSERTAHDRALQWGLIVLLLSVWVLAFDRANRGKYDFHHFYLDARYVWDHAELNPRVSTGRPAEDERQLPFYLPAVPLLLAPLTALGRTGAALIWASGQVAALAYTLWVMRRWARHDNPDLPAVAPIGVAVLLAVPAFIEAGRFNQVSYFVLAGAVGAADGLQRGRPRLGGALFGVITVVKLLPGIFLVWLALKRRWLALAAFVVVALLLALLPPLVAFGPQRTLDYHRQWWDYNVRGDSARGMLNEDLPEHFVDRRNQSITQVIARWTWPAHPHKLGFQPLHLDQKTCVQIARALKVLLALGLAWATRRAWERLSVLRLRAEFAAYAIGMLVFSPLLRQYYLVWAFPALVLLARIAAERGGSGARRLAQAGLLVWLAGMALWIWPVFRLAGAHLLMLIAVAVLLLIAAPTSELGRAALAGAAATRAEPADDG